MRPPATLATVFLLLITTSGCAASSAATPAFDLHAGDFDQVRGEYALADGRIARLVGTRRHPRLDIVHGGTLVLRPLSATAFVSDDGCARVEFELNGNASVARVRIARANTCDAH